MMPNRAGRMVVVAIFNLLPLVMVLLAVAAAPKADMLFVHGLIYQPTSQDRNRLDCGRLPAVMIGRIHGRGKNVFLILHERQL